MNWISKLEKKFGRYAIPNLMRYIIALYAAGFVLMASGSGVYENWLSLNAQAILHGQIWRIFTFILQPPSGNMLMLLISLLFYYMIGSNLEARWGTFMFNLYFLIGVLLHVAAALLVYLLFGVNISMGTAYLNLSLFFAFAAEYPDMQVLLFWIIPVKVKWIAMIEGAYFGIVIVAGLLSPVMPVRMILTLAGFGIPASLVSAISALVSMGNFLLFFFSMRNMRHLSPKQVKRKIVYQSRVKRAMPKPGAARHKCAICGKTEADGEDLEFRFCSNCDGMYEYCQEHLYTHKHVTKGS